MIEATDEFDARKDAFALQHALIVDPVYKEISKRFYESDEYQAAKKLREGAARFNMIAVEGL